MKGKARFWYPKRRQQDEQSKCSREQQRKRKSITKQSNPPCTQAPILSSLFDAKSNKSVDIDFEERFEAVRRTNKKDLCTCPCNFFTLLPPIFLKSELIMEYYDAPVESEKKTIGLGTKIGVGVAFIVFGSVFCSWRLSSLGKVWYTEVEVYYSTPYFVSPTEETEVVSNKLSEEEKSTLQSRLKQYETMLSTSPKDPTALEPFEINSNGLVGSWCDLGRIRRVYSGCLSPSGLGKVKYKLKDYEGNAAAYKLSAMASKDINFELLRGLTNALLAAKKPDEAVKVLLDS
ncbi:hypothetical protein QYF36_018286 [Acer negundo]|nr:hypothetical protein QYF36_018286 [Acer negundo]